jgi:hypothetical protein
METKIRDIANYIIIEKKLEKNVEEDRALEERDRLQKQAMVERATTIMGEPGPQGEEGSPAEQPKGSSLLGTLLRLGIGAFAIKFLWPALLPLLKGVLAGVVKSIFSWTTLKIAGLFGAIIGSIPLVKRFGPSAEEKVKKFLSPAGQLFENLIKGIGKDGKVGEVSGGDTGGGEGGGERDFGDDYKSKEEKAFKEAEDYKKSKVNESNLEFDDSMSETLEKKDLKKKVTVTKEKRAGTEEEKRKFFEKIIERQEKKLLTATNEKIIESAKRKIHAAKIGLRDMGDERYKSYNMNVTQEERMDASEVLIESGAVTPINSSESFTIEKTTVKPEDLSSNDIDVNNTQAIAKTNERIDNLLGGEDKEQNNGNLVSANKPQVTEANLKLASAPLPFVKVIKNNQLSTSPKSYNGLPPEIAAMIS